MSVESIYKLSETLIC